MTASVLGGKARLLNVAGGSGPDPRLHALLRLVSLPPSPWVFPRLLSDHHPLPPGPLRSSSPTWSPSIRLPRPPHLPRPALLLASAFTSLPQKAVPAVPPQLGQVLPLSILGLPWTPPEAHHTIFFIFTLTFIGV